MPYTLVAGDERANFERAIRKETRIIYIEIPSNPTHKIAGIRAVATVAKGHGIMRRSAGIEETTDLISDTQQALS